MSLPLTHLKYSRHCSRIVLEHRVVPVVTVQVMHKRAVLCGKVLKLAEFSETGDWFHVDTQIGPVWAESRNVRLCADEQCTCPQEVKQ